MSHLFKLAKLIANFETVLVRGLSVTYSTFTHIYHLMHTTCTCLLGV